MQGQLAVAIKYDLRVETSVEGIALFLLSRYYKGVLEKAVLI
jgi:hypothetical protein